MASDKKGDFSKLNDIITATELKNNLGAYLDYVIHDNEVVITKNGKKAARLIPYSSDVESNLLEKEKDPDCLYGGRKVSYEEFMEIYEKSDLPMEYIKGEIVLLSSPSPLHQEISGNLHVEFKEYFKGKECKVYYAPFDVHFYKQSLHQFDVMRPDLTVACDVDKDINVKGCYMGTPVLVVEILSPSTRSKDMVDKLNTYMVSGVREFWIIDPEQRVVLVYGFKNMDIDHFRSYSQQDTVRSYKFDDLKIQGNVIFP